MNIVESYEQFEFISKESKALVVYFSATWCMPCKAVAPLLEALIEEYKTVNFVKVDVDATPKIPTMFSVRGIPTILFIKDGKVLDQSVGAISKSAITERLAKLVQP